MLKNLIDSNNDTTITIPEYRPITFSKYNNAFFIGDKGLRFIYTKDQKINFHHNVLRRDGRVNVKLENKFDVIHQFENIFIFTDHYGDKGISHWMADQLFVVLYLHDLIKIIPNLKIIINQNRRPCMKNTMRDMLLLIPGIKNDNILEFSITQTGKAIASRNIYIGNGMKCGWTNINRLWKLFMKKGLQFNSNPSPDTKIYLSRRHTVPEIYGAVNTRKLINVEEVSQKIVSLGYQEVFTEKLSFEQKINLFKNTKNIICEIGAGIINFIHCENKPHIKIMLQDTPANRSFLQQWDSFLKTLDVTYEPIFGERVPTNERIVNPINTPWKLKIEKII